MFFSVLLLFVACDSKPDYVLSDEEMILLLIDIHKGEVMCEVNNADYNNDSLKRVVKQSIYMKHGVNQEQFDSLMVWYGHNIENYLKIYEEIISRLEVEEKSVIAEAARAGESIIEVGDSVNIWIGTPVYLFVPNSSNNIMSFDVASDETFEKGDRFEFSFRVFNNKKEADMFMAIDYTDGATSYISASINSEDKHSLKLQADSMRVLERIYGYLKYDATDANIVFVDSINIARERLLKKEYYKIRLQKTIDPEKAVDLDDDKEEVDKDATNKKSRGN